jgi:ferric-dicitrate binding protein FerR (iron transport regulator)
MGPSGGETPGTTSGAPWLRKVTSALSALQHKPRSWRRPHRIDETPYSAALTVELTWLSKSQRAQLEALAPTCRQLPHNVVEFRSYFPDRVTRPPPDEPLPPPPRWHWPTARIVTFALVVIASVSIFLADLAPSDYVSGVGERRVIHLDDGSTVTMNTLSRMRVWLTPHGRDIDLLNGEALFTVAHDAHRPFRVHVGPTVVEAVGTEFSVYRGQHGTKVSVVEGRVKIFAYQSPAPLILNPNAVAWTNAGASDFERPPPPIPVSAREEAQVSSEGGGSAEFDVERKAVTQEQIEHHLAWVNGQLIFENATLAETIEEFNRYNRRKLEISDPTLAQIRLGGAFSSTNVDEFIVELNALFRISAVPQGNPSSGTQVIRLQRGPTGPP